MIEDNKESLINLINKGERSIFEHKKLTEDDILSMDKDLQQQAA